MIIHRGVKTYSSKTALKTLSLLAEQTPAGTAVVEVGVFRGGSLHAMAQATDNPCYGIDTWGLAGAYGSGSEAAVKYDISNLKIAAELLASSSNVRLLRAFSTTAASSYPGPPIGLLYIDGEHTRRAVLDDFDAWQHHLNHDAIVCFDDYRTRTHDVMEAVNELATDRRIEIVQVVDDRLAITKPGKGRPECR